MSDVMWRGREVFGGERSQERPGSEKAGHWSLEAIWAMARPHDLAASPDGSTVAFVLDLDGTFDVWSMDLDGNRERITNGRAPAAYWDDAAPVFSPDGSRLAYADEGWVRVVDRGSGTDRRMTKASLGAWFDDSRMVVIVDVGLRSRLALMDRAGTQPNLIGPEEGQVTDPIVTDDGKILATHYPSSDMNRSDLVQVEPDGSWKAIVGHPDRRAYSAQAHGSRIVYLRETDERSALFLADLETGEHRALASGDFDFGSPAWSGRR